MLNCLNDWVNCLAFLLYSYYSFTSLAYLLQYLIIMYLTSDNQEYAVLKYFIVILFLIVNSAKKKL